MEKHTVPKYAPIKLKKKKITLCFSVGIAYTSPHISATLEFGLNLDLTKLELIGKWDVSRYNANRCSKRVSAVSMPF